MQIHRSALTPQLHRPRHLPVAFRSTRRCVALHELPVVAIQKCREVAAHRSPGYALPPSFLHLFWYCVAVIVLFVIVREVWF